MGLVRLGVVNPSANTSDTIFTSDNQYLVSVLATNKATASPANIRVWVEPSGSVSASEYSYIIYDLPLDSLNSYETFKFAVNQNDVVNVQSSTNDVSFSAYGLVQYDIRLGAGISTYSETSPSIPVDGMIWVDSNGTIPGSAAKPTYVYSAASASWIPMASEQYVPYTSSPPGSSSNGDLWYDTVNNLLKIYNGSIWLTLNASFAPYSSSSPASPPQGALWADSTVSSAPQLKVYDGSSWLSLGSPTDSDQNIIAMQVFR